MNLEATRLRGRSRNRWQDEVREDGRLVGGKGWKERGYITERNGRSSWERQESVTLCTCQWNKLILCSSMWWRECQWHVRVTSHLLQLCEPLWAAIGPEVPSGNWRPAFRSSAIHSTDRAVMVPSVSATKLLLLLFAMTCISSMAASMLLFGHSICFS